MLKNIDPVLTPELLFILSSMGHGDDIVVADANFPAGRLARETVHGRVIDLAGVPLARVVRAILSVLWLDTYVEHPIRRMAVDGHPDVLPEAQQDVQAEVDQLLGEHLVIAPIERFAFYEEVSHAYAIVLTGELRPWGDILIKKGALV